MANNSTYVFKQLARSLLLVSCRATSMMIISQPASQRAIAFSQDERTKFDRSSYLLRAAYILLWAGSLDFFAQCYIHYSRHCLITKRDILILRRILQNFVKSIDITSYAAAIFTKKWEQNTKQKAKQKWTDRPCIHEFMNWCVCVPCFRIF